MKCAFRLCYNESEKALCPGAGERREMFRLFAKKETAQVNDGCPCKRMNCERHGDCAACRAHHSGDKKSLPYCERESRKTRGEKRA